MAIFHRVVVDIVDMMFQVIIVYDQMFPIAAPPETTFAFRDTGSAPPLTQRYPFREYGFDVRPPHRKICITGRQRPQTMQMIRHNHDRINGERPRRMGNTERMAQIVDMIRQQ